MKMKMKKKRKSPPLQHSRTPTLPATRQHTMPITTPAQLNEYLEKQGYDPQVSSDSVFVPIGGSDAPYTAAFTFHKAGQLQITCQLALLGEFAESELAKLALA